MNLKNLVSQPQLVKITLDQESLVKKYGEPIEFYTWDRQPMDTFIQLAAASASKNQSEIITLVARLLLDENGQPLLDDQKMLPNDVLMAAVGEVTVMLGK